MIGQSLACLCIFLIKDVMNACIFKECHCIRTVLPNFAILSYWTTAPEVDKLIMAWTGYLTERIGLLCIV